MIVDFHAHLTDESWLPAAWRRWMEEYRSNASGTFGGVFSKSRSAGIEDLYDPDGSKLIDEMDEAGIKKSVILPLDFGLLLGEPETSIMEQNRRIGRIVNAHPSRLIGFAGVDPRRADTKEIIERGVKEFGFKGVKFHPGTGFSLDDEALRPVWDLIAGLGVSVMVHTGQAFGPLLSKTCSPVVLDEILARYPEIRIIAAHLGGGWFDELCWMGYTKPNLYADISLWQIRCRKNRRDFVAALRKALDMFGPERLLFGTDRPYTSYLMKPGEYIAAIRSLSSKEETGADFITSEIQGLLGKNAEKLLEGA